MKNIIESISHNNWSPAIFFISEIEMIVERCHFDSTDDIKTNFSKAPQGISKVSLLRREQGSTICNMPCIIDLFKIVVGFFHCGVYKMTF